MPPADSTALIVARFLKSNQYTESYEAFINEAGLPQSAGNVSKGDLTLETLLEEKKNFDLSVRFEKLGVAEEGSTGWTKPAPHQEHAVTSLPSRSNLLSLNVETFVDAESGIPKSIFLASAADRRLNILDVPTCSLNDSLLALQDSPILSSAVFKCNILLTTSMSGQVLASTLSGRTLDKRRDHTKYVVKIAIFDPPSTTSNSTPLIATAGWDSKVCIYLPTHQTSSSETPTFTFNAPIAQIPLPSKPESLLFLPHPQTRDPILLFSRLDSTSLFYYTATTTPRLLGKQNLAPHSNAWVAFTPTALAISPVDPGILAAGTNSVPHMKLLIVKLLVPPYHPETDTSTRTASLRRSLLDDTPVAETQASQARAALAVADREAEAILIHCTTMAPQTPYSTPAVAWRPDGSGVWVNGDDGNVRGIETSSGKVVSTLKGHEEGSKVRCLWAGRIEGGEEWLVSGGFDQKLIVWKV